VNTPQPDPSAPPSAAEHVEAELMPRSAARGSDKPPGGKRVGPGEVKRRLEATEQLLSAGATTGQVHRYMNQQFGIGYRTADDYVARVRAKWVAEDELARPARRAEQRRRLLTDLGKMRIKEGAKPWREIHMHEDLLAKIDGLTKGPSIALQVNNINGAGGWNALTEEQLAYMAINGGALPPGLSEESLLAPPPKAPAAPAPAEPAKATP
jgi:hypothetical protein